MNILLWGSLLACAHGSTEMMARAGEMLQQARELFSTHMATVDQAYRDGKRLFMAAVERAADKLKDHLPEQYKGFLDKNGTPRRPTENDGSQDGDTKEEL